MAMTGLERIMFSRISYTCGVCFSSSFFALFRVAAIPFVSRSFRMNGLKSSSAISFGIPHWSSLRFGPTTMTDLPE